MSSFVVEPAASSSQLYFAFCGVAEADSPAKDDPTSAGRASRVRNASNLHRRRPAENNGPVKDGSVQNEIRAKEARSLLEKQDCNPRARRTNGRDVVLADTRSVGAQGLPRQAPDRRIAQPVRVGSVMLELLRRYGITEEEIEEGFASLRPQPAVSCVRQSVASCQPATTYVGPAAASGLVAIPVEPYHFANLLSCTKCASGKPRRAGLKSQLGSLSRSIWHSVDLEY
jgi:hypothetical protein